MKESLPTRKKKRTGFSGSLLLLTPFLLFGMVQGLLAQSDRVVITSEPGFEVVWDGNNGGFYDPEIGAFAPDNDALGAFAFGSSAFQPGGIHDIININDGFYGNSSSWIADFAADPPDPDPYIGFDFGRTVDVESVAWSRDNGDETEPFCSGTCTDRAIGTYTIQFTQVALPWVDTMETGNASTGWVTVGSVEFLPGTENVFFTSHLRHRFDISRNGEPISATGLRIKVSDPGIAMDEIEVNPPADPVPSISSFLTLESGDGYNVLWDGNEGALSGPEPGVGPFENRALASSGTSTFGSSEFDAGGVHLIANVQDGLYGNSHSWLSDFTVPDPDPFVGLNFGDMIEITNLAWGRDNGDDQEGPSNPNTDRSLGTYMIQVTQVDNPGVETEETGDVSSGWATLGTLIYKQAGTAFQPHLRHRYEVADAEGGPVLATGLRIKVSDPGMVIDEIEVNANPAFEGGLITIENEPGFTVVWDGNEGEFFDPGLGASAPDNPALASNGARAIGSGQLLGDGSIHDIDNVIDGLYGNSRSWIPGPEEEPFPGAQDDPFIGVVFAGEIQLESIAWGRDNGNSQTSPDPPEGDCCGGQLTDRSEGVYTLQFTSLPNPDGNTSETGDASSGWQTLATIEYLTSPAFSPWLRHRFDITSASGDPLLATAVRIKVSNPGIAIDEIEVNPPDETSVPQPVVIQNESGFEISWNGNQGGFSSPEPDAAAPQNLALASNGTVAFGSSELDFGTHYIANINDGLYGNSSSWIANFAGAPPDENPFVGLDFGRAVEIWGIAWGRDNGNDGERDPAGPFTDRALGLYTIQITRVPNPGVNTMETGDPTSGWVDVGSVEFNMETPGFTPHLRHRFNIESDGEPVSATGLRIKVSSNQIAIDELEVNPRESLKLNPQPGFHVAWDGNEGEFTDPSDTAVVPDNPALSSQGTIAFGSSELDFGIHFINNINDGLYGNSSSWIANFAGDPPDEDPFVGLQFSQATPINSIAWGRDNGNDVERDPAGPFTDRALGVYTLQITQVANPNLDTEETEDPETGWQTLGQIEYLGSDPSFMPYLRHRFKVSSDQGTVMASGLRIKVSSNQIAIDEIEINSGGPVTGPTLSIVKGDGRITVSWDGSGTLQSSDEVNGTWTDIVEAQSPYTEDISMADRRFFRVRE